MTELLADLQAHFADKYELDRELGGGGMSRVFVARDARLDRRVVIKLLPPQVTATISAERFKREIMMAAGLQHPNIVPVLAAGEFGALPYFIMPYIDGESLRARMKRGPLSVRETVTILKDVVRALGFAHGRGIIHRDIKPDNVLIASGAAVVTDFGVAKALSASRQQQGMQNSAPTMTGVGTSLGTPAYMAPEQAAADPSTDHRADLYALGIVAYEMLTGAPPFHGRTPQALLAAQLSEMPAPLTSRRYDVSLPLSTLIMQCLEKEPAKRPKNANDVLRSLDDPGILVSDAFPAAEAPRLRRRRFMEIGIGVLVVAAVAAAWVLTEPEPTPGTAADSARIAAHQRDSVRAAQGGNPPAASAAPVTGPRSVAVFPLVSVGNDTQASQAAEGITSELATAVSRVPGVRVSSQTTAAAVRQGVRSPAEAARALNATMLIEGTVQRARDRLRVSVRLVNVGNDSTVWASTFNGTTNDALALQDSTVKAVAAAVAASANR
ncbi:MAG TPA: serine/threonine-protein kinase [Gemmatimonadaceae bacterium]|nr:serine/threonine-protein kinase [Gemmatimonadaceae bacterium]